MLGEKVVLVTGGTGSFWKLLRGDGRVKKYRSGKRIVFRRSEIKLVQMRSEGLRYSSDTSKAWFTVADAGGGIA